MFHLCYDTGAEMKRHLLLCSVMYTTILNHTNMIKLEGNEYIQGRSYNWHSPQNEFLWAFGTVISIITEIFNSSFTKYPTSDTTWINSSNSTFTSNMPLLYSDHKVWSRYNKASLFTTLQSHQQSVKDMELAVFLSQLAQSISTHYLSAETKY